MRKYRLEIAVSLLLIIGTFAVYLQATSFEFVHAEDFVIYNELSARLKAFGFTVPGIFQMPSNAVYMVPFSTLMAFCDLCLFGDRIGPLHLYTVTTHAINTLLLFYLLRSATACLWQSAFAAAMFAFHPVNTENVVSWCRGPALFTTFFFLVIFLVYIHYVRKPSTWKYGLMVVCLILGLLAKPTIIFLPITLFLFDFWPLRRLRTGGTIPAEHGKAPVSPGYLILEKIPLVIVLTVWMGLSLLVIHLKPQLSPDLPRPESHWFLLNIPVVYTMYLWKLVYPFNLPLNFPDSLSAIHVMPGWQVVGASVLLAIITITVICARKKAPFLLTGWLWFLFCLAPFAVVCVSQQRPIIVRYAYMPMIGLSIITAWGGAWLMKRYGCRKDFTVFVAVGLLLFFMATSWIQAKHWADKVSYFQHAATVFPDCEQRRLNLGEVLFDKGRIDEALKQFEVALALNPDFSPAHNHLGMALMQKGQHQSARFHFQKAILLNPEYSEAHNNLANQLADSGNIDDAIRHYHEALRIDPSLFQVHNNLATVLAQQGLYDRAISHFEKAIALNPGYQTARDNLEKTKRMKRKTP